MRHVYLWSRLPAFAIAVGYMAAAAPAAAQQEPAQSTTQSSTQATGSEEPENRREVTSADLVASAGFSGSPFLQSSSSSNSRNSSVFGRLSIAALHGWNSERGSTTVTGFLEGTTYLRGGYGSRAIFRVGAQTNQAVSETVKVYANVGLSGDVAGQLSNRFTTPVEGAPPPDTNPAPDYNPDYLNLTGRQYRVNGQVGASIVTSPLSSMTLSAGATHAFFTGQNKGADYTTYMGSVGYSRVLSERTTIGTTVSVQHMDFSGSDYSNVINPALNIQTKLGEDISAGGSIGLLAVYSHRLGLSDHSYSPSFSANICKSGVQSNFCASVSRTAQTPLSIRTAPTARGAAISTSFNLNYSRTLGEGQTIRALVSAATSSRVSAVSVIDEGRFRTTYVSGLAGYDRKVGNRLYAGASAGARKLFQTGPDPKTDFNGNLYLRYRLGDIQ